MLRRFYNEAIVPDPESDIATIHVDYKVSESGHYRIFDHTGIDEILTYIDSLPSSEEPEVFGLHPNASIAFQMQESDKIISTVLNV